MSGPLGQWKKEAAKTLKERCSKNSDSVCGRGSCGSSCGIDFSSHNESSGSSNNGNGSSDNTIHGQMDSCL